MRFFLCSIFIVLSSLCAEEPFAVYLTWQKDPSTTMTIQWITSNEDTDDVVQYKCINDEKDTWTAVEGEHEDLPQDEPYYIHRIELEDLQPQSAYSFKLGNEEKEFHFETLPDSLDEPVVFIVGGDTAQNGLTLFEEMCKVAQREYPSFILFGGDLAYAAGDKNKKENSWLWLHWLKTYYETMQTDDGFLIPFLVTIGNHDVKGGYNQTPEDAPFYYTLFPMPGIPGYNVLRFGEYMSLFLLDSGHTNPIKGEQSEWLQKELALEKNTLHRFAIYHVPAFPSVRNFRLDQSTSIRRNWVPLFERYGLHVAFENHDHAYKRTYPLLNESVDPKGVVYIGDGSWGVRPRIPKKARKTFFLAKSRSVRQCLKVEVSNTCREFTAINSKGHVIDHYVQYVGRPLENLKKR